MKMLGIFGIQNLIQVSFQTLHFPVFVKIISN